jgi:SpoU rRNA methylase family enzyme
MMQDVAKIRTTLTIDEAVMRAVKLRAAATGRGDSEIIEESLRRDLGLSVLDEIWDAVEPMAEDDAMDLALEAQRRARR